MKKYVSYTLIFTAVVTISSGCEKKLATSMKSDQTVAPSIEKKQSSNKRKTEQITVYYGDPENSKLKVRQRQISFVTDDEKYKAAFKAMQHSDDHAFIPTWSSQIGLKSLKIQSGIVTLDIHIPDTARVGSAGELLMIDSLKKTMFQFKEMKAIEILVDGEQVESLMGHLTLPHPIKPDIK